MVQLVHTLMTLTILMGALFKPLEVIWLDLKVVNNKITTPSLPPSELDAESVRMLNV